VSEIRKNSTEKICDDIAPELFHTLQVDLIGLLCKVEVKQANSKVVNIYLKVLTIIDVETFLFMVVLYCNKNAVYIVKLFSQEDRLCQYPRPEHVIHENGNEVLGAEFQEMLHSFDIAPKPTTVKNPQANSVIKQVHLKIRDRYRMEESQFDNWEEKVRSIFISITWAARSTVHSVQLAIGDDMLMRTRMIAD